MWWVWPCSFPLLLPTCLPTHYFFTMLHMPSYEGWKKALVTLSLALPIWLWLGCDTKMPWSCMYYSVPSIDPNKMVSAQFSLQFWVPTSTAWGMKSLGLGEKSWGKSRCQYSLHSRQLSQLHSKLYSSQKFENLYYEWNTTGNIKSIKVCFW